MQAAPPSLPRPHWIPMEPSWLVALALVLLAVLPHQLPRHVYSTLRHPLGAILLILVAAALTFWFKKPVLGIALLLLVAAVQIRARQHPREGFAAPILVKDRSKHKDNDKRWLVEETLNEDPHGTQEHTEEGGFLYDEVDTEHSRPWFVEDSLGEHTRAIQDRPVGTAGTTDTPYETGASVRPFA